MTDINEQAFWRACEPLKEEGMNISNYLDQLSGVLFLKACDASGKVTFADIRENGLELPSEYRWDSIIRENDSEERLEKYNEAIEYLKHNNGEVSREAFKGFTPQFDRAATFSRTVDIIENIDGWENYDQNADVFGDAHEYLLEKYVDKAEGAGEYFTPRHLVNTMVRVTDPEVGENIIDPAAGTNGFLVSSYNHMKKNTDDFDEAGESVEYKLHSREIQRKTYRLGLMKYILHDIDPVAVDSMCEDSLRGEGNREEKYDVVLANPPFGPEVTTKYDPRCDSKIETNFLMMMIELLDQGGRAAIVVPEGILFDGAKEVVRKNYSTTAT
jgi:type I restriction enzyme M protein